MNESASGSRGLRNPVILVAIIAAMATVGTAVVSYVANWATIRAKYVEIAAGILQKPKPQSIDADDQILRKWAVGLINNSSPVPLPKDLQDKLTKGEVHLSWRESVPAGLFGLERVTIEHPVADDESRKQMDSIVKKVIEQLRDKDTTAK